MYLDTNSLPTGGLLIISRGILLAALSLSIQEQREQVKKSYQRLLTILDALEELRRKGGRNSPTSLTHPIIVSTRLVVGYH